MNTHESNQLIEYRVWDRTTRLFHWLNFICVLVLMAVGLVILNAKTLGIEGEAKILLKTLHAYTGYVFVVNLLWRIAWGFFGGHYSRWTAILPFTNTFKSELKTYIKGFKSGNPVSYAGHNPAARIAVTVLFVLLSFQALTGLILAGTDLYLPPFGHEFKEQVMAAGEDHSKIRDVVPGKTDNLDPQGYEEMRAFRKPFITVHLISFYCLLAVILVHIAGVVITELREGNSIISAMFTGRKHFRHKPVDQIDQP